MSKRKKHNATKQKENAKQIEKQRQMAILVAFYKRNLDVFIERELGVKLTKWQKFVLKRMVRLTDEQK